MPADYECPTCGHIDEAAYLADLEFRGTGQVRRPPPQRIPEADPRLSILPTSHVLGEYKYRGAIVDADSRGSLEEIDLTIWGGVALINRSVTRRYDRAASAVVRLSGSEADVGSVTFGRGALSDRSSIEGGRSWRTVAF